MVEKLVRITRTKLIIVCLLGISLADLFAADIPLRVYLEEHGLAYSFDPFREIGTMNKKGTEVRFSIDMPFLVVDYIYGIRIEPFYRDEKGDILVPQATVPLLTAIFNRDMTSERFTITTIIIDPGHGGKDPGTIGTHIYGGSRLQLREKDLVLDVSRLLFSKLKNRYPQKRIELTRDSDVYLELEERTEIANKVELDKMEAMIFVSVHANASLNSSASGFEVWYLPPDYRRNVLDPELLDEDEKEIAPILNTIMEEEFTVESVILARSILASLDDAVGNSSINRGMKEESWFVVRNAKMPSVLVEIGFVTNKDEALLLAGDEYLIRVSDGIYNGLVNYIDRFDNTNGFTE